MSYLGDLKLPSHGTLEVSEGWGTIIILYLLSEAT